MVDHSHQSVLELRPQLDDKLVGRLDGEGRRDEADMQRAAEGHEHVDCLPVIQPNDGVHTFGELGANCQWKKMKTGRGDKEKVSLWTNYRILKYVYATEKNSTTESKGLDSCSESKLNEYNLFITTGTFYFGAHQKNL